MIRIFCHKVQLPDRIIIYELATADVEDMQYKWTDKILKKVDCNLLVVCSKHIIFCQVIFQRNVEICQK